MSFIELNTEENGKTVLPPTTQELLQKRSEEEKKRFEKLSNPTFSSPKESDNRGAVLLAAVLGN